MSVLEIYFNKLEWMFNSIRYALSSSDKDKIISASFRQCWLWYDALNSTRKPWPEELLPEADDKDRYIHGGRRVLLMEFIQKRVGERYLLRCHNSDMTEQEFNDFWYGSHLGVDQEAYARYQKRIFERLTIN